MAAPTVSNWGRWGAEDELGTLNLLTLDRVRKAVALVKRGVIYSLAVPIEREGPILPTRNKTWHINTVRKQPGGRSVADDVVVMHTHGTTHIDALCHVWYGDRLYNGHQDSAVDSTGSSRNSIDRVKGLVGRGVLLDLARHKGVDRLPNGYVVQPQEMEACARAQGVTIGPGDILLLRTGWLKEFSRNPGLWDSGEPGPGREAVRWLRELDICAIGADNGAVEVVPPEDPGQSLILHQLFIRDVGGYIMEFLELEELARDQVYEFLFVAAPLRITKGVGSPLNPLAIA